MKGWLVAVAANEARRQVRRQHPGRVVELQLETRGSSALDPAGLIDRVDLVNALAHLKTEDRALLALRYVAGLEFDDSRAARDVAVGDARPPGSAAPAVAQGTGS